MDEQVPVCRVCDGPLDPAPTANTVMCLPCWRRVPGVLRIAAITAYRRRRSDPTRHGEAQIGIFQWCMEQRAGRIADRRDALGDVNG